MNALSLILALAAAEPSAGAKSNEAQMAKCAWAEAPATAAVLVAWAKFDKRYVYDADGSPTVGPLMRVRAACWDQSKAFAEKSGQPLATFDNRQFV